MSYHHRLPLRVQLPVPPPSPALPPEGAEGVLSGGMTGPLVGMVWVEKIPGLPITLWEILCCRGILQL